MTAGTTIGMRSSRNPAAAAPSSSLAMRPAPAAGTDLERTALDLVGLLLAEQGQDGRSHIGQLHVAVAAGGGRAEQTSVDPGSPEQGDGQLGRRRGSDG